MIKPRSTQWVLLRKTNWILAWNPMLYKMIIIIFFFFLFYIKYKIKSTWDIMKTEPSYTFQHPQQTMLTLCPSHPALLVGIRFLPLLDLSQLPHGFLYCEKTHSYPMMKKIIAQKRSSLIPNLIFEEKGGFVKNR